MRRPAAPRLVRELCADESTDGAGAADPDAAIAVVRRARPQLPRAPLPAEEARALEGKVGLLLPRALTRPNADGYQRLTLAVAVALGEPEVAPSGDYFFPAASLLASRALWDLGRGHGARVERPPAPPPPVPFVAPAPACP
jgi:hypothetical protein